MAKPKWAPRKWTMEYLDYLGTRGTITDGEFGGRQRFGVCLWWWAAGDSKTFTGRYPTLAAAKAAVDEKLKAMDR